MRVTTSFKAAAAVAALLCTLILPGLAQAQDAIAIVDPYARASTGMSTSGAVFMVIENHSDADDRLISAASDAAERVELHTHKSDGNGVMQMIEVPEGFVIPAGGSHALQRGADHVMFLGLNRPLRQGDTVEVTLAFERAGEVVVQVPVDIERKQAPRGTHGQSGGMLQGIAGN